MLRILVVEDDPATLAVLESLLRGEGYMVQTAPDGRAGLEKARAMAPDILVTDIEMPGLTGNQLTAAVRGDPRLRGIYVLALTVHGEKGDKLKALLSGVDDFLVKPAGTGEILGRVAVAGRVIRLEREGREAARRLASPDPGSRAALEASLAKSLELLAAAETALLQPDPRPARARVAEVRASLEGIRRALAGGS